MKSILSAAAAAAACTLAQATVVNTSDAASVAAFQQGLSVQTFENVAGRTPMPLSSYTGAAVDATTGSRIYDQVPGFRFSSGGVPGEVFAALFELGGSIAGDAVSGKTVLAPLTGDNQVLFDSSIFLEAFLPTRVSDLGFWVSPAVGKVRVIFTNSNFAFDKSVDEEVYEVVDVTGGHFVGLSHAQADIGGFKVLALNTPGTPSHGFTLDDLSFGTRSGGDGDGGGNSVPEPASGALALGALLALRLRRR